MWRTPWHIMIGFALIAVFFSVAAFVWFLLYGEGVTVTIPDFFRPSMSTTTPPTTEPVPPPEQAPVPNFLAEQRGALFECAGGKALKAEFSDSSVALALSDGRVLNLPRIVTETQEIRYENTDGSFSFRNTERTVFVQESGATTYADCTSPAAN